MSNVFKKLFIVVLSFALMAGVVAPASAATTEELQAQIAALMAQINALNSQLAGTPATTVSSYTFTRNLTVGSTGADVKELQKFLVSGGYLTLANPTTYFGSMTKAALAKFQAANGIAPAVGYFGSITRAKVHSMMVTTTPTTGTGTTPTTGTGTTPTTGTTVPTGTGMTVSLASDNPIAQNVAINPTMPSGAAELVNGLSLNFTAGASDVVVTGLNVTRGGLSADSDLQNVYLVDGAKVVATNLGINNGLINFSSSNLFTVKAGTTKNIKVAFSISSSITTSKTYVLSLANTSAVAASASVNATYPIMGNVLTGTVVSQLGALTINNASAGNTSASALAVNAGQTNFLVGQFTVQASNQTVQVKSLKFTNTGSTAIADIQNIKLYNGATLLGAASTSASDNTVTFDLSASPMQLTSGQTAVLYLYADVMGGVNRNFQFSIQHNYDVVAQDMMYNVGILPALTGSLSTSFPVSLSYVNVQAGTLTVTRDTASPINYVLPGGTNQTLAKIDFAAAGEAIRVTGVTPTLTGTFTPSTITNLKLVDDQGQQIGTTQATVTATGSQTALSNLNYVIAANSTRVVSVIADVSSSASGTITAGVTGIAGQGYTSLASVSAGAQTGNSLTASTNTLTAALNSAMGTTNVVSGKANQKVASFTLTAGPASGVNISNVSVTTSATATTSFQNLKVMIGSAQLGQTQGTIANSTAYTFTAAQPLAIAAGGQLIVDVYADVKTGVGLSSAAVVNLTGLSGIAVATNQAVTTATNIPVTGQTVAVVAAGTMSFASYNHPASSQVGMGVTGVKLATYQLTGSANEPINVNNVWVTSTSTLSGAFTNITLKVGGTQYGSGLNLASGAAEFVGVNIPVAQSGVVYMDVYGDANSYANLSGVYTASSTFTIAVNQIDYQGTSSNTSTTTTMAAASTTSNTFQVVRTPLSVAQATGVTYGGSYTNYLVGAYTFSAGANNGATISSLTLSQLINNSSTSNAGTTNISLYDTGTAQTATSSVAITANGTATVISPLTINIPAGSSKTIYVYSNVSSFTTKPANSSASITDQINLSAYKWSDGTVTDLTANPSYNLSTNVLPGSTNPVAIVQ